MKQNIAARNFGIAAICSASVIAGQSWSGLAVWLLALVGSLAALQPWQLERALQRSRRKASTETALEATMTR